MRNVPICRRTAAARVAALERQIVAVDARLRLRWDEELERRRLQLEAEHARLYGAGEVLEQAASLPKCSDCGKATHPDRAGAERHLSALRVISRRQHDDSLRAYMCGSLRPDTWHVGHSKWAGRV